jgi:hypothetical protein
MASSVDDNKLDETEKSEESEEQLLDRMGTNNIAFVDVTALAKRTMTIFRGTIAYLASILESMTANICLFCASVAGETIVFSVWGVGFQFR